MNKEKIKEFLWNAYFGMARVILTVLATASTILALWDWSYSTRGYGAIGGEIVLAILVAFIAWKAMGIIADWHKSVRTEEVTAIKIICEGREFIVKERK
jgi:hypothetical protein